MQVQHKQQLREIASLQGRLREMSTEVNSFRECEVMTLLRSRMERMNSTSTSNSVNEQQPVLNEKYQHKDVVDDKNNNNYYYHHNYNRFNKGSNISSLHQGHDSDPDEQSNDSSKSINNMKTNKTIVVTSIESLPTTGIALKNENKSIDNNDNNNNNNNSSTLMTSTSSCDNNESLPININTNLNSTRTLPFYIYNSKKNGLINHNITAKQIKTTIETTEINEMKENNEEITQKPTEIVVNSNNESNTSTAISDKKENNNNNNDNNTILLSVDSNKRQHYNRLKMMYDRILKSSTEKNNKNKVIQSNQGTVNDD